ncbi:hydroxymethylpyrimidine kinase/phosphomethylpyrimidine kinase/thiamine-phosphate diphosphorylase [Microbacterium sp. W4I4]|uniref:bifunctional hydroxymethylpyrimidine kinase/phosphomethylpyrimidine kinase n=1 Tax=Microbacterium sp. W4I4 TaxID=3042295 RepID=UPI00278B00F8|nr:bifunctional hydroxymethylpyrimidine kinase/phosphomethylpyrimidine kinase [Microbacterium sp. W4I4]MDQ0615965.1 hydroxymethylpyrimidine kinase/phosphomethylpyrimidine kinase/thiamine-phosphate diphosphorylase [Microbacterium sp. W4I4]
MNSDISLHLVTDAALCGERGVVATVDAAVAGGVAVVQLRDKTATDAETVDLLVQLSQIIDGRALLVVNDRLPAVIDARARGARVDGVHLGQSDISVERARALLGPDALIGLTANTPAHLDALRALPEGTVDYIGVGVIRPTSTKPDHPPALGVDGFRALAASSPVPAIAIGGIGRDDVAALRDAGAAGVAVVSALCAADDPQIAARAFRREWRRDRPPRVLSIAGSDPSGGAGIQADLKSIAAHGGYGMAAITALTAQNTRGVSGVHVPPASFLRAQLDALASDIDIDAVKIGMLADAEIIRTVSDWLTAHRPDTVVLDPVMVATSGDRLLDVDAETALLELARQADLLTPNLGELAVLAGRPLHTWADALVAAQEVAALTGALVLAKGGHLPGDETPDALVGSAGVLAEYRGRRIETTSTHGTGCSLSSALAATRARGMDWVQAVEHSRAWLRESLSAADALDVGRGHGPISHFAGLWQRGGLAARPHADAVREDWWSGIADIRRDIDDLPFIRGLADGTLSRERFLSYLAQDALYLQEYARVLAEAARLAPTPQEQAFWAASAQGAIAGEVELHASWITPGAGVSATTFAAAADATTTAYLDHLRAVAFGGDYAVLIAALLPCFWLYTDLGVRLQAGEFGDRTHDPRHPYSSWLATYADPAFAAASEHAIGHVTRAAAQSDEDRRRRMHRAFAASAAHERAFFDR